jgi:hypothetical protein
MYLFYFFRLLKLTLIFLGIVINSLLLYRLSYFEFCSLITFVYFCVPVLTMFCRAIILVKTQYLRSGDYLFPSRRVDMMKDATAHCVYIYVLGSRCSAAPGPWQMQHVATLLIISAWWTLDTSSIFQKRIHTAFAKASVHILSREGFRYRRSSD